MTLLEKVKAITQKYLLDDLPEDAVRVLEESLPIILAAVDSAIEYHKARDDFFKIRSYEDYQKHANWMHNSEERMFGILSSLEKDEGQESGERDAT